LVKHFTMPDGGAAGTVAGMNNTPAPTPHYTPDIESLATLQLVDGLPADMGGKTIKYRTVRLRETTVADERAAVRMAERVVQIGGLHKLLASEGDFRYAMTFRHIAWLECDGQKLLQDSIDLEVASKLSPHDWQLIETRVMLMELAAQVRYGLITPEQFDLLANGGKLADEQESPQPLGQVAGLGAQAAGAELGPALLADYAGQAAAGAA
jgi:phage FluMu protein gp41